MARGRANQFSTVPKYKSKEDESKREGNPPNKQEYKSKIESLAEQECNPSRMTG
jgi:hypothetical protein